MQSRQALPDEADTMAVFNFLVSQIAEVARFPVDEERSTREFWRIFSDGKVYVAEEEGVVVGTLAVREVPVAWYAPENLTWFVDEWYVVHPDFKGRAGRSLMALARREAVGKMVVIRRLRNQKSRILADILGYNVVGNVIGLQ